MDDKKGLKIEYTIEYTDEDKQNMIIKQYTAKELKATESSFRKSRNTWRVIFFIILLVHIGLAMLVESDTIQYFSSIAIAGWSFVIVIYEYAYWSDLKVIRVKHYIEIIIDEKLEIETDLVPSHDGYSSMLEYYPVKGTIAGTNYQSVFL